MNTKVVVAIAFLAIIVGGVAASLLLPDLSKDRPLSEQTEYMSWYPQPRALNSFSLTDHTGNEMTNEALEGSWTLAFVGYTYCPDICPVTLAEINKIYPQLSALNSEVPVKIWFLSVDPKRDSIARLNEYINYFNPSFVASTGPHTQLFPLVRSMGMMYSTSESTDNPNYLVDHSASIVVINPLGQVVGRFKPQHTPGQIPISDSQQILSDLPKLLGV